MNTISYQGQQLILMYEWVFWAIAIILVASGFLAGYFVARKERKREPA